MNSVSKKNIVTGGLGFIGSNLVRKLVDLNQEVVVIDDLSSGRIENYIKHPNVKYILGDCRDFAKYVNLEKAGAQGASVVLKTFLRLNDAFCDKIKSLKPSEREDLFDFDQVLFDKEIKELIKGTSSIYHLAAMPRIQPSFDEPVSTLDRNVQGTAVVCALAKHLNANIVYAGSSSFYGDPYKNPYSFSKWQGEETCRLWEKVYGVPVRIARFFNVYGPGHLSEGAYSTVVAIFEKQFTENQELTVTGTGQQRRDFTHVDDICDGLIEMAANQSQVGMPVMNLGASRNYSILELAALFGPNIKLIPQRPGEAQETLADLSITKKHLKNWSPKHNIEDYVAEFKANVIPK